MTDQELAEAKQYGRESLACDLIDRLVDFAYLFVFAIVFARPVDTWLSQWSLLRDYDSFRLVALLLITIGCHILISFPISLYSGFVLEHRYELSNQTFAAWLWRYAKRITLAIAFATPMFLGLFWLIWTTGPYWWLVAAGAFFVVSVILGQLMPVVILPLFYKIEPLDDPELTDRMAKLAEGTGLSIEGVYRIGLSEETVKANAMLAGLGRTRRVLMGDTLIDRFSADEIEVIFGHEIAHHVFRHIRKLIAIGIVFSMLGFLICNQVIYVWVVHCQGQFDYRTLPVSTLPLFMLVLTIFTTVLEPLQNAVSRHFERQSDRYALQRTKRTDAYTSAFQKLAKLNKDDPDPHWLEVLLFHSHPPISERLAIAQRSIEQNKP